MLDPDPDPYQMNTDPQPCWTGVNFINFIVSRNGCVLAMRHRIRILDIQCGSGILVQGTFKNVYRCRGWSCWSSSAPPGMSWWAPPRCVAWSTPLSVHPSPDHRNKGWGYGILQVISGFENFFRIFFQLFGIIFMVWLRTGLQDLATHAQTSGSSILLRQEWSTSEPTCKKMWSWPPSKGRPSSEGFISHKTQRILTKMTGKR